MGAVRRRFPSVGLWVEWARCLAHSCLVRLIAVIGDEGALGPGARTRPDIQHGEEPLHVRTANDVSRAPSAASPKPIKILDQASHSVGASI